MEFGKQKKLFISIDKTGLCIRWSYIFEFHLSLTHFFILYRSGKLGLELDLKHLHFQFIMKIWGDWDIISHLSFSLGSLKEPYIYFKFSRSSLGFFFDILCLNFNICLGDGNHEYYDEHTDTYLFSNKKFEQLYPNDLYKPDSQLYEDFSKKEYSVQKEIIYKNYLSTKYFRIFNCDFLNEKYSINFELCLPFMRYVSFSITNPWKNWKYLGFHIGYNAFREFYFQDKNYDITLSLFKYNFKIEIGKNSINERGNNANFTNIKRFLEINNHRFISRYEQSQLLDRFEDNELIFDYLINEANFDIMSLITEGRYHQTCTIGEKTLSKMIDHISKYNVSQVMWNHIFRNIIENLDLNELSPEQIEKIDELKAIYQKNEENLQFEHFFKIEHNYHKFLRKI